MTEQNAPTTATRYYLIELRDSDGNDCAVAGLLIEAESKDAALDKAMAYVRECCHGGVLLDGANIKEYLTKRGARAAMRPYHVIVDLT